MRSPDAAQRDSDAPQIRGPEILAKPCGSRFSSAPFHGALRPGHEAGITFDYARARLRDVLASARNAFVTSSSGGGAAESLNAAEIYDRLAAAK